MSILVLAVALVLGPVAFVLLTAAKANGRHRSSVVRVPVDDFVVGDLPFMCARTGEDADGLVDIESDESAFQSWWLLLLVLGPVGVVAILLLWTFAPRPPRVGGSLPMTYEALADQNRLTMIANWAWTVPLVAFVAGAAMLMAPRIAGFSVAAVGVGLLTLGLVGGFVTLVVLSHLASRRTVRVRLDGSGRWVELRNVHPSFATATDRQTRARHRAARERRERLHD